MGRLLIRRFIGISAVCLLVVLVLAVVQAGRDIRQESRGAGQVARLAGELLALERAPADELPARLDRLKAIGASGDLRHLAFQLEDGDGQVLVAALPGGRPFKAGGSPDGAETWTLTRADGAHFRATLIPDPASERREAVTNILGVVGLFLGYAAATVAGLFLAVRHAFTPLRQITSAIAGYRKQDYSLRLPGLPVAELDHIAASLNHLAEALGTAELRERQLKVQMMGLQEDERARLAMELNECFAQDLAALRANAAYIIRRCADTPALLLVAREMDARSAAIQQGIRGVLHQLRPDGNTGGEGADGMPVQPLLHELVKSWQDLPGAGVDFSLDVNPPDLCLPRELSLSVYRMTQEALANVARHADARRVEISLNRSSGAPGWVCWSIRDDGVGLPAADAALGKGCGLAAIRERVWGRGGRFEMGPVQPDAHRPGLCLSASLPANGARA